MTVGAGSANQRLLVLQSLWAVPARPDEPDAPPEDKIERIAAGGFDGVSVDCVGAELIERVARAAWQMAMSWKGQAIAPYGRAPTSSPHWRPLAIEAGISMLVETHRGRLTDDLPFTLALLDCDPAIRLLADLSHYRGTLDRMAGRVR